MCASAARRVNEERTACIKRIREMLAEFGIVLPQSPRGLRTYCTISWKMRAMTSQAQPALRYSVHSCIDKSSMNIFTGVSSVLQLTVKKMPRCSELPPSRAWDHSLH